MKNRLKSLILTGVGMLFLLGSFWANAQEATLSKSKATVIFLVRHAEQEKESKSGDPPLSTKGQAKAELLAATLSKENISAVYATNVTRAIATATPILKANKIEVSPYKLEDDENLLINNIVKKHQGENVVIIGHSGNIADLLNAATKSNKYNHGAIDAFNDFYILTFEGDKNVAISRLSY